MNKMFLVLLIFLLQSECYSQSLSLTLEELEQDLTEIETQRDKLRDNISKIKWSGYKENLKSYGLPSLDYLEHIAYFFEALLIIFLRIKGFLPGGILCFILLSHIFSKSECYNF